MINRTGQEPLTHSNEWQAGILLREYDNLARDNRTLVMGQYTLGVIGVALVLGLLGAAFQVDRAEMLVALPGGLLLVASLVGVQLAMMHYIGRHLWALENRINGLCAADQSPLLTWYSRYNFPHLGDDAVDPMHWPLPRWLVRILGPVRRYLESARAGDPMTRWLLAIHLLVFGTFVGLFGVGAVATFNLVPGALWKQWAAAVPYGIAHVIVGGFVGWTFTRAPQLAARTYARVDPRNAGERAQTEADAAAET